MGEAGARVRLVVLGHQLRRGLGAQRGDVAPDVAGLSHEPQHAPRGPLVARRDTRGLMRRGLGIMAASPAASLSESSAAGLPYQCCAAASQP